MWDSSLLCGLSSSRSLAWAYSEVFTGAQEKVLWSLGAYWHIHHFCCVVSSRADNKAEPQRKKAWLQLLMANTQGGVGHLVQFCNQHIIIFLTREPTGRVRKFVKLIKKGIGMKVSKVRPESKCKGKENKQTGGVTSKQRNWDSIEEPSPPPDWGDPQTLALQDFRTAVTSAWLFASVILLFEWSYLLQPPYAYSQLYLWVLEK